MISGIIKHSSYGFQSDTLYEALSYVWGDALEFTAISINGLAVTVTTSLAIALRHLRHPDQPRILWIDYICINQEDVEEKSREVRRMGSIYERADSVVIWLGLATPQSSVGMEILRYFAHEKYPLSNPLWQTYPRSLVYHGLWDVMTRPWFERMWVVQEAGRSQSITLLCGQDCVPWESTKTSAVRHFTRMIKYAEILPEWTDLGLNDIDMQPLLEILDFQDANQSNKPWGRCDRQAPDLLDLAHKMRHKKCSDPRDKIFGLWGLVDYLASMEDFKLGYGMTVAEVYTELARVSFDERGPYGVFFNSGLDLYSKSG